MRQIAASGGLRVGIAALAASIIAVSAAAAAPSPPQSAPEGLANFDRRDLDPAAVRPGEPGRLLTGRSDDAPVEIALDYVRAHGGAFGLRPSDVANLVLVARDVSPDGITHLRFNQVLDGIESYDSGIDAHVTADGRLITVNGSGVPGASLPTTQPQLGSLEGLAEARDASGGPENLPRKDEVEPGPSRETSFSSGEHAELRWSEGPEGPALVWQAFSEGAGDSLYEVLVDAEAGEVLRRQDLTSELGQIKYFPRDPDTTPVSQITMPAAWYSDHAAGTRLWGQYARTYADPNNGNPPQGSEQAGTQIPASSGAPAAPDWLYTQSHDFPGATPCPTSGCTWNSDIPATRTTNMFQAGANLHVLVSDYAEYLAQPPIGFDEASGNFQRTNSSGQGHGNDYVRAETNNPAQGGLLGMMTTPPDGQAPRMEIFLATSTDTNASDSADIVYHEYGHGLEDRLVVNAAGTSMFLGGPQTGMMRESVNDFYALDRVVAQGLATDAPGVADVHGTYLSFHHKFIDCPVNPAGEANCNGNGTATTVLGGYTFGDLAVTANHSPYNGGEFWAETMWDIRKAVGRQAALALITGGMRLSPDFPAMLDMRDAILQQAVAMRSAADAPDDYYPELWAVFAERGMGASATSPEQLAPAEAYDLPTGGFRAIGTPVVRDPYPEGDDDGMIEPGERFVVEQTVQDVGLDDLPGVTGTLSSDDPAVTIEDGTAAWPLLGKGRIEPNADPLAARLPLGSCLSAPELTVDVSSSEGAASASTVLDLRKRTESIVNIPDGGTVDANWSLPSGGTITDVDLRIDELRHNSLGNLEIRLIHDGVTVVIDGPGGISGAHIFDAIFDDEAVAGLPPPGGPVTGRYKALGTPPGLAAFDGHPAAGLWTLRIADTAADNNTGQLRQWGLDGPQVPCNRVEIPAASTGVADGLTDTSANLKGTVTPNGRATGIRFSYGTTSAYGASTPVTDVGSGDGAVAGLRKVAGLQPATTYHYRVEAMRDGEVAIVGQDRTFTTAEADMTAPRFPGGVKVKLKKAGSRKRATFKFSLSEPATVTVSLKRGRRPIGKATRAFARAGAATLPFPKRLRRGRYSATLIATDLNKNRSRPTRVRFRVR